MSFILCGEIASGKDTVAEILGLPQLSFGTELKRTAAILENEGETQCLDCIYDLLDGIVPTQIMYQLVKFRKLPVEPKSRLLLQELGTYLRKFDSDVWIRPVLQQAQNKEVTIVDCRYLRELQSFSDFVSIYIDCPLDIRIERVKTRDGQVDLEMFNRPAEQEIKLLKPKVDFVVDNSKDKVYLELQLKEIQKYLQGGK